VGDPRPLDRSAVSRVLRRASEETELGAGGTTLPELGAIDEQALVAAAVEVGIPAAAVHRAIAIERLGPRPAGHLGDRLVGAGTVVVDEELPGRAYDVIARIDAWLVDGHHLRRDRLREDRGEWSKRSGVVGAAIRTLRGATGEGRLGDLHRVAVTARDTGTGTCVVRVEADRRHDRSVHAAAGAVVAGAGTAGVVAVAVVTAPALLLVAPLTILAGAGLAATGRGRAARVEREVTRVIDAVDQHVMPARLRVDVMRRVAGRPRRA
jgi:hypothetical protein